MIRRIAGLYREAFSGLPREIWLLAIILLINRCGTMVLPFLSLYLTGHKGFSIAAAGQVVSLYGIGSILGTYLGGWATDRIGGLRVQLISLILSGAGFIALGYTDGRWPILIAVLLLSIVADAYRPATYAIATTYATTEQLPRSFGLLRLAVNLAMSIGPTVGGFLALYHYGYLFWLDGLTSLAAAALIPFLLPPRHEIQRRAAIQTAAPGLRPWMDRPYLMFLLLTMAMACAFMQLMSTVPLYLKEVYHLNEAYYGSLLALNTVIIVLFEMLLVKAIENGDRLKIAALGTVLVCAGWGCLALGRSFAWAAVSFLIFTAGEMFSLSMLNAAAGERAPASRRGQYMAAYTMAFSISFVLGPLLGTKVYEAAGPEMLWLAVTLFGLLTAVGYRRLAPQFANASARR